MGDARAEAEREGRLDEWGESRIIPFTSSGFYRRWRKETSKLGLRPIPPSMLRHTSDTLGITAGVDAELNAKMHGRTNPQTTYAHYYRPDLGVMEEASRQVSRLLEG